MPAWQGIRELCDGDGYALAMELSMGQRNAVAQQLATAYRRGSRAEKSGSPAVSVGRLSRANAENPAQHNASSASRHRAGGLVNGRRSRGRPRVDARPLMSPWWRPTPARIEMASHLVAGLTAPLFRFSNACSRNRPTDMAEEPDFADLERAVRADRMAQRPRPKGTPGHRGGPVLKPRPATKSVYSVGLVKALAVCWRVSRYPTGTSYCCLRAATVRRVDRNGPPWRRHQLRQGR